MPWTLPRNKWGGVLGSRKALGRSPGNIEALKL